MDVGLSSKNDAYFTSYITNIKKGISYYRSLTPPTDNFTKQLNDAEMALEYFSGSPQIASEVISVG